MNAKLWTLLALASPLVSCQSAKQESTPAEAAPSAEVAEVEVGHTPISLEDWTTEHISLPPGFAPGLPPGDEVLLFAPGMFDPQAEDFWSYAFLMRVDESDVKAARVSEFFEEYYDGLIIAVGGVEVVGEDPAAVHLAETVEGSLHGVVSLIDAFATGQPLDVNLWIEVTEEPDRRTLLRVKASPQPRDHEIWGALDQALKSLSL